jgi:hypothetical protein
MPFNQALFWFGLTAFATGLYYLWDSAVKRLHSVGLTIAGTLACAYVVYRDSHPELPVIHLWVILLVLTWALLGYGIYLSRFRPLPLPLDSQKAPSKLVIHSANYAAWSGGGQHYDVTKFVRSTIRGDSLVFSPIENHSFVVDGENLVPHDPLVGKPKRLEVTYSYNGEQSKTVRRTEHGRLTLPEDSAVDWLGSELEKTKAELRALKDAQPKSSPYPVPELRMKVVALVSDLQGFLGQYGQEPRLERRPSESDTDYLTRWMSGPTPPWRAKTAGNYRLTLDGSVRRMQDEIRARTGINDLELDAAIGKTANDVNHCVEAIDEIIRRLWSLALRINV